MFTCPTQVNKMMNEYEMWTLCKQEFIKATVVTELS